MQEQPPVQPQSSGQAAVHDELLFMTSCCCSPGQTDLRSPGQTDVRSTQPCAAPTWVQAPLWVQLGVPVDLSTTNQDGLNPHQLGD
jgi:hypothetical protein